MTTRSIALKALLAVTAALPIVAGAGQVAAQTVAATADDEILVTARKREESLQDVPVAITAFGSEEIQSARIEGLADVSKLTPGLNFTPLFGAQNQLPIIRGAAQTFGVLNVGVFLDGVYLTGKAAVDLEISDLERVEVVKGPQSALYGRNTFAGAINYVTKRPGDDLEARAEYTYGEYGLRKALVSASVPVAPGLGLQIGAYDRRFDGWYRSAIDGGRVDFADTHGAMLTLAIDPNERLSATARLATSSESIGQPPASVIRTNSNVGVPAGAPATGPNRQERNLLYVGELPSIPLDGVMVNTQRGPVQVSDYGQRGDTWRASLAISYDFDAFTLASISAYSKRETEYTFDGDNTICDRVGGCPSFGFPFAPAIPFGKSDFGTSSSDEAFKDRSQEFRISSATGGRLTWMAGLYWFDSQAVSLAYSQNPLTAAAFANNGIPRIATTTESFAQFASVGFAFTDRLRGTFELRHETEDQTFKQAPTRPGTGSSVAVFDLQQSFEFTTPRATLDYDLAENTLLYATVARGAKTGGFNTNLNISADQRRYGPEYSWNYEVGSKNTLWNRAATLNTALFYTDWEDQQVACQNPVSFGGTSTQRTYVCNVGQAKIWGVELDGGVRLTDWLSITGNYAWTDAKYEQFVDDSLAATLAILGQPPLNFDGRKLPYVPEHKFAISPRLTWTLGRFDVEARADVAYQSKTYLRADNLQFFGDKTTVDLRASVSSGPWRVQAFVDNVFDDDTPTSGVRFFDSVNYFVAAPLVFAPERRLAGVTLGVNF
jgi:iron complex outermembrane receptor protein